MDFLFGMLIGTVVHDIFVNNPPRKNMKGRGNTEEKDIQKPRRVAQTRLARNKMASKIARSWLTEVDAAHDQLVERTITQVFGKLPELKCKNDAYIRFASSGSLNILKRMTKECLDNPLTSPNMDDDDFMHKLRSNRRDNPASFMEDPDFQERRIIRQESLLAAGLAGHLHVLQWLENLDGYNLKHQWMVIYKERKQELFYLWESAVSTKNKKLLVWLEKQRAEHVPGSTRFTYFDPKTREERKNMTNLIKAIREMFPNN